jgi:hypothetical protein
MTTVTKDNFCALEAASCRLISTLRGADRDKVFTPKVLEAAYVFFFEGESPRRHRRATVTNAGKLYDFSRRTCFATLEAWHASVLEDYPHMPLSALRFGRAGMLVQNADAIEAVLGWEQKPLTGAGAGAGAWTGVCRAARTTATRYGLRNICKCSHCA